MGIFGPINFNKGKEIVMAELSLREPDDDLISLLRKCTDKDLEPL